MIDVKQLEWDAIPEAHRIHCWMEVNVLNEDVVFQGDHADTGCWETVFLPPDNYGPVHVIYFRDRLEVWRYWTAD